MQSLTRKKGNGYVALFMGIITGFVFLVALFAGLGVPVDVLNASVFIFIISVIAIGLMFSSLKKKR